MDKELLRRRLAFIRQGSEVERFHTKRTIQLNDVGHHSFHVAWLAYLLAEAHEENSGDRLAISGIADVVMAALGHDLAEHITGDMPGDFKREMGIREQFSSYEVKLFKGVQLSNFEANLYAPGKRILKLADMMEGAFFCISEASLGNARFGVVFRNFRSYIGKFEPFNATEDAIIEYIDELWAHYGVDDGRGWDKSAHKEESMQDENIVGEGNTLPSLTEVLRREEAEGRATPAQELFNRDHSAREAGRITSLPDGGEVAWGSDMVHPRGTADPSKAAETGDGSVPSNAQNDAMDEPAQPDLPAPGHTPANARQHGGDHYKGVGYEHWDLVLDTGMNYFQGCATKYVTRARKHESGSEINLLKAIHYVDKLAEAVADGRVKVEGIHSVADIIQFGVANRLNDLEVQVIKDIVAWRLEQARLGLTALQAGETEPTPDGPERSYYSD